MDVFNRLKVISALLALVFSVHAGGSELAFCPRAHRNEPTAAEQVWELLERRIPRDRLSILQKQWEKLTDLRNRYNWNELLNMSDSDPRYPGFQLALAEIRRAQATSSTTLSGTSDIESHEAIERAPKNWNSVIAKINGWVREHKKITFERVLEINATLGDGQLFHGFAPGSIRQVELISDTEGDVRYFPARDVAVAVKRTLSWLNRVDGRQHPIEVAGSLYQRLVTIHPTADGNGRTCRATMEWYLQQYGFPPPVFIGENSPYVALFADRQANYPPETAAERTTQGLIDSYSILLKYLEPH